MADHEETEQITDADGAEITDETPEEAAKRKFKEALDRKRNAHHGNANAGPGGSKVHGAQSQAGGKRTFRRKAGG